MPLLYSDPGDPAVRVRRVAAARLLLALPLLLAACSAAEAPPAIVGAGPWAGTDALFLARDRNLFEDGRVHLVELTSAGSALSMLRTGAIDAAVLPLDDLLRLAHRGPEIRVVALLDLTDGQPPPADTAELDRRPALKAAAGTLAGTPFPLDVLVVRRDRLEPVRPALTALLRGWYAGLGLLQRDRTASLAQIAGRLHKTPAEVAASLAHVRHPTAAEGFAWLAPAPELERALRAVQAPLLQSGQLRGAFDLGTLFDPSLLREAGAP